MATKFAEILGDLMICFQCIAASKTALSTVLRFDMFDTNDDGLLSSLEVEQLVEHSLREESQMDS